jgi:hypothetical protein
MAFLAPTTAALAHGKEADEEQIKGRAFGPGG